MVITVATTLGTIAMHGDAPAYGLWFQALVNARILILFAFSFFKPKTAQDWRSLGAFSAFIVALFVEMYGFPLTLYLLAGWIGSRFPELDPLSHDAGHLWPALFGWSMDPHWSPFHILSYVLIGGGFFLIASGLFCGQALGSATPEEVALLDSDQYTCMGAERAGSENGVACRRKPR